MSKDLKLEELSTNPEAQQMPWMKKLEEIITPMAEALGCQLYDLEFSSRVLRVYIDKDPQVGIKDCESVSRALSEYLDVNDVVPGEHYQLEVSTPGLERVLKKDWHFKKAIGKKIKLKTKVTFEQFGMTQDSLKNSRSLEHTLDSVENDLLCFMLKEGTLKIPISALDKARVVFELEKNKNEKNNNKKRN